MRTISYRYPGSSREYSIMLSDTENYIYSARLRAEGYDAANWYLVTLANARRAEAKKKKEAALKEQQLTFF